MPFNSFSVVMVLITPSALSGHNRVKFRCFTGIRTDMGHTQCNEIQWPLSKDHDSHGLRTPSWLWWSQKPFGGRRRPSRSDIAHTVWWMWTCHSLNGMMSELSAINRICWKRCIAHFSYKNHHSRQCAAVAWWLSVVVVSTVASQLERPGSGWLSVWSYVFFLCLRGFSSLTVQLHAC